MTATDPVIETVNAVYLSDSRRFLGRVEVAQQANQRREHAPRLGLVNACNRFLDRSGSVHRPDLYHEGKKIGPSWLRRLLVVPPEMLLFLLDDVGRCVREVFDLEELTELNFGLASSVRKLFERNLLRPLDRFRL